MQACLSTKSHPRYLSTNSLLKPHHDRSPQLASQLPTEVHRGCLRVDEQVKQLADQAIERAHGIPVQRLWGKCEPDGEAGGENVCANALNRA